MKTIKELRLTGERALFNSKDLELVDCIFADGESPLKESCNIIANNCSFQWKYPFWYCNNITINNGSFLEMGRAGVWYSNNVCVSDTLYEAPKGFRRVKNLKLTNVDLPHAEETLWNCDDVVMENVIVRGDYFAMNCNNITVDNMRIVGNYCFDGCKNVTVKNSKLLSKDAFWNCDNVTVIDSYITGEYLAWNSTNVTFINCTIESLQGLCYIDKLVMKNCKCINTTLAFEYSNCDVEVINKVDSVINPKSGTIRVAEIGELILEKEKIDTKATEIICEKIGIKRDKPDWV